ncbi:MAG: uroporphyrinogen decarboxylase family protein [Opitutales bacterium]|nr:uroporphyrinogen decarboxylase family protein [Opitutales bacterium]
MTPKERYLNTLQGKPCDCLPRVPILMQFAAEYIGSNYGAFAADYRILAEANYRCAKDFDFDQLSAISDPYRETAGFGGITTFVEDGVPRCSGPLEGDDDIDVSKLPRPDPLQCDRMRDRIEGVREMHRLAGETHSIMGWVEGPAAEAADLRGLSNFFMDLLDDKEGVDALMERTTDNAIHFAHAQIEAGADTVGIGEAMASQVSAETYAELILPYTDRLVRAIRERGAFVKLHVCGNITHLLPHFRTMPINILDLDHLVDTSTARQLIGPGITLCTNLDPSGLVCHGNPETIRAAVLKAVSRLGNPCMINAGCEIPSGTPEENLRALCTPVPWKPNPA